MNDAIKNLKEHQQQLDADGCMVGVSRQALDETLTELDKLRSAVFTMLDWATYETEYDGRMYEICQSCDGQDGAHRPGCELPAFRALAQSTPT